MAGDAKAEWVLRVLGMQLPEAGAAASPGPAAPTGKPFDEAAFRKSFRTAVAAWQSANADVDGQLNELRRVLLATNDAALHRIAEYGLNGITGKLKVGLQKSLIELGGASGPGVLPLARKARQAAEAFQGFVQTDVRIKACDAYPKITTPIGATLGGALGALAQALTI